MAGQKHRIGLEEMGFNPANISWVVVPDPEIRQGAGCSSGGKPCMECDCCKFWTGVVVQIADKDASAKDTIQELHDNKATLEGKNQHFTEENASAKDTIQKLHDNKATLEGKNQQLTEENASAKDTIQKLQASKSALKSDNERTRSRPPYFTGTASIRRVLYRGTDGHSRPL